MNYWALFFAGITDSYNPCSIGVLLITLTILIGLGKRSFIALFGLTYLTTIFLTYFLIGIGLLRAFHLFGVHGFFGYTAGAILIIFGLAHLLPRTIGNLPFLAWINRCRMPQNIDKHLKKGVVLAGVILGFLIGLCTVPCAGGIYLGAIGLLATRVNYWQGLLGLLIFNIGFILPLLLIFFVSSRKKLIYKISKMNIKYAHWSVYVVSLLMIIMGVALIILSMAG